MFEERRITYLKYQAIQFFHEFSLGDLEERRKPVPLGRERPREASRMS
jgi:hypothetical protein